MHNNIMAAGSKERPPMLGPGRYSQWRSRFLRYIDTKPNGEGLRKSILSGPYVPSTVLVQVVAATEGVPAVQQHTTIETVLNMTPENKEHFLSEKEAIFLLLTGIGDDIYSTVDACKTANEMWIAIERLQQGESLNVQDVKTNLFWEFGKFTSRDGESMESYYSRQKCKSHALLLRCSNQIQSLTDQAPKPQRSNATSSSTRPSASTRHKGKEIAKPVTPQSESVSEEDSDPEQAQRDKEMQKICTRTPCKGIWESKGTIGLQALTQRDLALSKECRSQSVQHSENNTAECADERAALANLIANLTLDTKENKTILKQLKKANASITQELEECKLT
ncbi:hypothetical protein Tco_0484165 [Tanacetum coccineum]